MPHRERARRFVAGLVELVAIVLVLGVLGAALGIGLSELSKLSRDEQAATSVAGGRTTTSVPATTSRRRRLTKSVAVHPVAYLRVEVLDARLFTDGAPSGTRQQPARMTVRIRASNPGSQRVTLDAPVLAVGSVRIPTDPGAERAGSQIAALRPGVQQTVTLRFALAGEATPKVVRDRRARVLIAGRSVATTVRVRGPVARRLREQISVG